MKLHLWKATPLLILLWGMWQIPLSAQPSDDLASITPETHLEYAIDYYKQQNFKAGLVRVKGGLMFHKGNTKLLLMGGIMSLKLQDYQAAHSFFNEAINNGMDEGAVYFYRGICNIKNHNWQWAVDDFTQAINRPQTAEQLIGLDRALGESSHISYYQRMPYIQRALAYCRLNHVEAAVEDINKAPTLSKHVGFEFYYVKGVVLYTMTRFEESLDHFAEAAKMGLNPDADFYGSYGKVAFYSGNYDLAIKHLSKSLELNDEQSFTKRELAIALMLNGEASKAIEFLGSNVLNEPNQGIVYFDIGYFHHLQNNEKLALKFFKKAIATDPGILTLMNHLKELTTERSPIRGFIEKELKVAHSYLDPNPLPVVETEEEKYSSFPNFTIEEIVFLPDPVRVNEPFDLSVNFRATVPYSQTTILHFRFTVSKNGKVIFKSKPAEIKAERGDLTNWTQHMKPVPKKGEYELTVYLDYIEYSVKQMVLLRIE